MRVFLSYASEQVDLAEHLALDLRSEGYQVFFDKVDLPAGHSFNARIRKAVFASDLFLFLISPTALEEGAYALTELAFAKEKWPLPAGRVIPVMAESVDLETVPPYLRSISIIFPRGNLVADVLGAVAHCSRGLKKKKRLLLGALLLPVLVLMAVWAVDRFRSSSGSPLQVSIVDAVRKKAGFYLEGDIYTVQLDLINQTKGNQKLRDFELELDHTSVMMARYPEQVFDSDIELAGGETKSKKIDLVFLNKETGAQLRESQVPQSPWRVCWGSEDARDCAPWVDWVPKGQFVASPIQSLPAGITNRAKKVVSLATGDFLLALDDPAAWQILNQEGEPVGAEVPANGEISAMTSFEGGFLLGTYLDTRVLVYQQVDGTYRLEASHDLQALKDFQDGWGDRVSERPVELALVGDTLWMVTTGGIGNPGLFMKTPGQSWQFLPYSESLDVNPDGLRLRVNGSQLYGVTASTSPASLITLSKEKFHEFAGHDYEPLSCLGDIGFAKNGHVYTFECDNHLNLLKVTSDKLEVVKQWTTNHPDLHATPQTWEDDLMEQSGDWLVGAFSSRHVTSQIPAALQVVAWDLAKDKEILLFENLDLAATSLAVSGQTVVFIAEFPDKHQEGFLMKLPH